MVVLNPAVPTWFLSQAGACVALGLSGNEHRAGWKFSLGLDGWLLQMCIA